MMPTNFTGLFLILKARMKIVLFAVFVTVLTATIVSLLMPKYYKASTQLVVNYKGADAVTGSSNPSQLMPSYLATQVDIIKNRRVALMVTDNLELAENPVMQEQFMEATEGRGEIRQWIATQLLKRLEVAPLRDSSVLEIIFTGKDRQLVADVANEFAVAYQDLTMQLKVEPAEKAAGYFSGQVGVLRNNLEQAQSKLSQYQQEKGLTSSDERLDIESSKLSDLSQQLVMAQSEAIEAQSRRSNAEGNANTSPDVSSNPVIQGLRTDAARASAKLAEISERLGPSHPQYQAAAAELRSIRGQLSNEIGRTSSSVTSGAMIQQQRAAELRVQVAQQKQEVLKLNRMRDELAVLQKDVESAQKALDTVTQRFSQTTIEAQSNHNDIAVLSAALPPGSPYTPRVGLNIMLSLVIGLVLGFGLALIAELLDRRLRSSDELAELLRVPVVSMSGRRHSVTGPRLLPSQPGRYLPSA
ncbi:MAG: chain length determinant protein EpsF [Nitrosomonadales bacterium]|nr:chain length determinant protein EpsF [Nitrosomonadales bacterium]